MQYYNSFQYWKLFLFCLLALTSVFGSLVCLVITVYNDNVQLTELA
jgi:uncharacterized protein YpmS